MNKKATGRKFTPEQFRSLNQCVFCGFAGVEHYGGKCDFCKTIDFSFCEVCEIVLFAGELLRWRYDIKETFREGVAMKPNKELVVEFTYVDKQFHAPHNEQICEGCVGWEDRIKDICWFCDNDFDNNPENYKANGNMCEFCAEKFNKEQ